MLPCAALTLAAIIALGPSLGHALLEPGSERLWPPNAPLVFGEPEEAKHARYLIALLGPALLATIVLTEARWRPRASPVVIRTVVLASQALTLGFVLAAILGQSNVLLSADPELWPIFGWRTYLVAGSIAAAPFLLLRRQRTAALLARATRETTTRRVACACVAVAFAATWLLTAITTDEEVGLSGRMNWTLDDPFSILDGRVPLVDFRPVYGHLSPYPIAGLLQLFGTSIFVYSLVMAAASGIVLLAVYAMLRRVARSSMIGLILFLPFLAIGYLLIAQDPEFASSNVTLFSIWPLRFGGAYVLAWLTARHLDGSAPRRASVLFLAAGIVTIDVPDFGAGAFAATAIALAAAQGRPSVRGLVRLGGAAAVGLAGAVVLVTLFVLAWSGRLPDFASTLEFPRIYGVLGLVSMPMPTLGFHLALYATFAAAIAVAAVRVAGEREDRLLTAMLAWSGVFGLIAGGYFVGRSEVAKLVALFSPWGISLSLLTLTVGRARAARAWRRPALAELMVLFGFGIAICALVQVPAPWTQIDRIGRPDLTGTLSPSPFVAEQTRPHERVALLAALGHRTAYELRITDVAPYGGIEMMATRAQMEALLRAVRRERAHAIFVPDNAIAPGHQQAFSDAGFSPRASGEGLSMWADVPTARTR